MTLAGGIAGMGFQCGQLWGAALAAGAQAYKLYGPGPQAEAAALSVSQRLVETFRARYKSIDCLEVTQLNWKQPKNGELLKFFLRGGALRCFTMTAGYARAAFREINTTDANEALKPILSAAGYPVSCAAVLARQMGASDQQATMAAGFAGGIGLSGGACGALGAAIWLHTLNKAGAGMVDFNSPEVTDTIDRFVENSETCFECSEIVGRKFTSPGDHAAYLREGGCAKIIAALAH